MELSEQGKKASQQLEDLVGAWNDVLQQLMKSIQDAKEAFLEFGKTLLASLMEAYRNEGAIYGDTEEGMLRWWQEKTEARDKFLEAYNDCTESVQHLDEDSETD